MPAVAERSAGAPIPRPGLFERVRGRPEEVLAEGGGRVLIGGGGGAGVDVEGGLAVAVPGAGLGGLDVDGQGDHGGGVEDAQRLVAQARDAGGPVRGQPVPLAAVGVVERAAVVADTDGQVREGGVAGRVGKTLLKAGQRV